MATPKYEHAGQPMKYQTVEALSKAIENYFATCDRLQKPYTISGLAVFLGVDRQTILNYAKNEQYFGTIKAARDKVQAYAEEQLYTKGIATGVIFNLVNNFGFKNTSEVKNDTNITMSDEDRQLLEKISKRLDTKK